MLELPRWLTFEGIQHLVVAYLPAHFSQTKCGRSIEHELARWPDQEPKCEECRRDANLER